MALTQPIRVVLAKIGLDGHDRGIQVVARALRDAGMEVIYTGLWQTPDAVVRAVEDEDADVVGVSLLSGAHTTLVPLLIDALRARGLGHVLVIVGGIIPAADIPRLEALGVGKVFTPGAGLTEIAGFSRGAVRPPGVAAEQSSPRESRP
jgi:methylmalonyl-CoA mutase, C-terminal domain